MSIREVLRHEFKLSHCQTTRQSHVIQFTCVYPIENQRNLTVILNMLFNKIQ